MTDNTNALSKGQLDKAIAKLSDKATSFVTDAITLSRQVVLYAISPEGSGNAEPISRLHQALLNLNHKGMAQKLRHWVEDCSPFKLKADTVSTFNKRKNSELHLRDETIFKVDFLKHTREAPKKAAWSLEAAIKKAIEKAVRDKVLDERSARMVASNAALGYTSNVTEVKATKADDNIDAQQAPTPEVRFVPSQEADAA